MLPPSAGAKDESSLMMKLFCSLHVYPHSIFAPKEGFVQLLERAGNWLWKEHIPLKNLRANHDSLFNLMVSRTMGLRISHSTSVQTPLQWQAGTSTHITCALRVLRYSGQRPALALPLSVLEAKSAVTSLQ